jgi:hypothetical protein
MQNASLLLWHKIVSVTKHPNLHLIQVRDDDSMAAEAKKSKPEKEMHSIKLNGVHTYFFSKFM